MKTGTRQAILLSLFALASVFFHYGESLLRRGVTFNDGAMAGYLLGIASVLSLLVFTIWGYILIKNFMLMIKADESLFKQLKNRWKGGVDGSAKRSK